MALLVNARSTADVTALLRAIRRELWTRRLADDTVRGLWWLAASALVLGFTHRWITGVAPQVAALVACLPVLVLLGLTLARGRPRLASCARRADQWFHGKEIMVSAWELSRSDDARDSWTSEIVMSRARDLAQKWRQQLPHQRTDLRQRIVIPVSIALAGVFLLVSPGGGSIGAVVVPSSGRTASLSDRPASDRTATLEIRQAPEPDQNATATPSGPGGRPNQARGSGGEGARRIESRSTGEPDSQARESKSLSPTTTAARATGRGISNQPRGKTGGESLEPIPEMSIRFIDVPVPGHGSADVPDNGRAAQLDERATPEQAPARNAMQSAGAKSDTRRFNDFSPALRSYVANYMEARANQK